MPSTQLTTRNQYDILGKVISSADPKNYTTTFEFNDRFGSPDNEAQGNNQNPPELSGGWQTFAFATKVTNAYGTTNNNGNVLTQRILVNSLDVTQTYTYDEVNRLKTAEEKQTSTQAQIWKQAFTFDRYGNRNFDVANTTANVLGANPTISQSNNRFNSGQSYLYDLAGNVTAEPGNKSYTYDGENHQLSFTFNSQTTSYSYDGDGRRVRKANPDGTTIVYVYNAMGQMLAEYTTGTASGTSGTSYITADHLGSTRVVTKTDGTIRARYDFLPFGEEIATNIGGRSGAGYVTDITRQKFTSYERDNESNLDFAQARMFAYNHGRFTSPDPTLLSVNGYNPQTWNRYAYVLNNPLMYVDPLGLWAVEFRAVYKKKDGKDTTEIDHYVAVAVKTKDDDDAASLAKQLGLTGKAAEKFAKNFGEKLADGKITADGVQLSKLGGDVGRIFGVVQDLYTDQKKYEAKRGKDGKGPGNATYADCSTTSCNLADPTAGANGQNWSVFAMDNYIRENGLDSVAEGDLRIGDILRYATGEGNKNIPAHFTTFIFMNDNGTPLVFSRSGAGGPFEVGNAKDFENARYGRIRGIGKDPTGYYRPR